MISFITSRGKLLPFRASRFSLIISFSQFNRFSGSFSTLCYRRKQTPFQYFQHYFKYESKNPYSKPPNQNSFSLTSSVEYEQIAEETLQSLTECFEELLETSKLNDFDVNYSNDVLTVSLSDCGTYVINKQSPNKQLWLSSPISGPKRYDFVKGTWIYKRDGVSLHQLLSKEMTDLLKKKSDFESCSYGK